MSLPAKDLVYQTSTSSGTGNLTLATVLGRRTFVSVFPVTTPVTEFHYFIANRENNEWEVGVGYMSDSTTLVRQSGKILASSNSNALVDFTASQTKDVTNDIPAQFQVKTSTTSVTNNHVPIYDGTSGSLLKSSGVALGTLASTSVPLAINLGGTNAQNATDARTNLGLGSISTQASNNVSITGGTISGLSPALTVASGGTGLGTLTANNVILGNGTSAPNFVAPSTNGNVLTSNGTTWTSAAPAIINGNTIQRGTAQASTSGTSIDFTSIPSWAKKITIVFYNVSTNGASSKLVRVGVTGAAAGTFVTSGYVSTSHTAAGGNTGTSNNNTTGFVITSGAATDTLSGSMTLYNITSNTWISNSILKATTTFVNHGAGDVVLGAVLDRVRITTVNGTDAFDLGTINVMYEG